MRNRFHTSGPIALDQIGAVGVAPDFQLHRKFAEDAATYFDPKTGWQLNGSAIYCVNFENEATEYNPGDILNLEGNITKNFGRRAFGVTGYAMIQTTPDSGAGAQLGDFESRVNGKGRSSASRSAIHGTRSSASTIKSSVPRTRSRATPSTSP